MKKILILILLMTGSLLTFAQEKVSMADTFRSNGKIYVVVAVILTIFAGIIAYLIRLDRKITRLEKETKLNY
jgi:hypothetical protein